MKTLPPKWIDYLTTCAESGMSYHKCKIIDKNGEHIVFVLSGELVEDVIDIESITHLCKVN